MAGDSYLDCIKNDHSIFENDIVLVGSDGLFDNVYDDQITILIN
jgi:serine/threonine protein phosphatase PrpC